MMVLVDTDLKLHVNITESCILRYWILSAMKFQGDLIKKISTWSLILRKFC